MALGDNNRRIYTYVDEDGEDVGIEIYELAKCFGYYKKNSEGEYDLGLIVENAVINMWAKYKAFVKVNKLMADEQATEEERREGNYGLYIPYATSPVKLKNTYYNQEADVEVLNGWSRVIPRGEDYSEPYRILDFDGYWADAKCPFRGVDIKTAALNKYETSGFQVAIPTFSGGDEPAQIMMTDIAAIAKSYFTIQLKHRNPSGNGIWYRTISAEKTVAESDGGVVDFSTYQLPVGDYDVIPFFSPVKFTKDNDGSQVPESYKYIPIPKFKVGEMKISDTEYSLIYFDGFKNIYSVINPAYGFSFNFAVRNNTENAHTFNDVVVKVRFPEKKFTDTLLTSETMVSINPFTVASGETKDYASTLGTGAFVTKWVSVNIGQELYNNPTGIVVWIQLGSGQEEHKMFLRSSETDTPEYDPSHDYEPIVPEV